MKKVEVQIYDDWYEIIVAQYEAAKKSMSAHGLRLGTREEFVSDFVGQMLFRECNEEYMDTFEPRQSHTSGLIPFKPRPKR